LRNSVYKIEYLLIIGIFHIIVFIILSIIGFVIFLLVIVLCCQKCIYKNRNNNNNNNSLTVFSTDSVNNNQIGLMSYDLALKNSTLIERKENKMQEFNLPTYEEYTRKEYTTSF